MAEQTPSTPTEEAPSYVSIQEFHVILHLAGLGYSPEEEEFGDRLFAVRPLTREEAVSKASESQTLFRTIRELIKLKDLVKKAQDGSQDSGKVEG